MTSFILKKNSDGSSWMLIQPFAVMDGNGVMLLVCNASGVMSYEKFDNFTIDREAMSQAASAMAQLIDRSEGGLRNFKRKF